VSRVVEVEGGDREGARPSMKRKSMKRVKSQRSKGGGRGGALLSAFPLSLQ
jgi:hypothetical protein